MIKKIILFILILIFYNCGYIEIKNKNLIKPHFETQKSLILNQSSISFNTTFKVYEFKENDINKKNNILFKITKKNNITDKNYEIKNLKNNDIFILEEIDQNSFYIKDKNNKIISIIKNLYTNEYLNFEFNYNNKEYLLVGEQNELNNNTIYYITYKILKKRDKNKNLGYIYKQFYYMKNEYDIIINKNLNELNEDIFIILTIFIDDILKKNGFFYRN